MQEKWFLLCLRNPCENTFLKLQIFVFFYKRRKNNVRVLAVCMKTKHFFFLNKHFFCWQKPGIFIPDLYLYSTKIQTCRKSQIFWIHIWKKLLNGPYPAQKKNGPKSAQQHGLTFYRAGLSPAHTWCGLMLQPEMNMDWLLCTCIVTS